MKKSKNNHPGKTLINNFLKPSGISGYKLATDINIPQTRVSEIIRGNRRITADTALRLSKYFNNTANYWLNLQNEYDLVNESKKLKSEINKIRAFSNKSSKKDKK